MADKRENIIPGKFSETLTRFFGALTSGKSSAYLALCIKLLSPITKVLDSLFDLFSRKKQTKTLPKAIMIVSPPRSGSTIIFQTVARVIPGLYFSNLHAMFPRHASKWIYNRDGRITFRKKNYYGYTASMFDVYEGNEYIDPLFKQTPKPVTVRERFLNLMIKVKAVPGKMFLFKSVRNYNNVALLSAAVPEVLFIRIRRNIEQLIQSEHRGYKDLKTFHPIPDALKDSDIKDPLEFNVKQILEIEREIDYQKEKINPDMWIEWDYEAFCKNPITHIQDLAVNKLNIPESELRFERLTYTLKASNRQKVSDEEAERIKALINTIKKK